MHLPELFPSYCSVIPFLRPVLDVELRKFSSLGDDTCHRCPSDLSIGEMLSPVKFGLCSCLTNITDLCCDNTVSTITTAQLGLV